MDSQPFKYDIFISFADEDSEIARNSANKLRECGMNVFFSKETLRSKVGQQYLEEIFEAMRSSEHLLLIASNSMLQSKWVKREYQTFFNTISIESDDKRRILIYLIEESFEIKKLPLYLMNYQVASVFDDILVSLGKSPDQVSENEVKENKPGKQKQPKQPKRKKEVDETPEEQALDSVSNISMFLIMNDQEQNYTGIVNCFELKWEFNANNYSRFITRVVDVRTITYKEREWLEIIHLVDSLRNYCYFRSDNHQTELKLFKLGLILKSNFTSDPEVIREFAVLESERRQNEVEQQQQQQQQQSNFNTSFQKGNLLGTYTDVFYRHWDERSLAFGTTRSSTVAGVFNVYSNCFEFISTEFNFAIFSINNIYFLNQNAEYVNNYIKVDYIERDGVMYTYLFYRFSFFGDSPTVKMYNEVAALFHSGALLFHGR